MLAFKSAYRKVKHVVKKTYSYFIHVCKNDDYDWDYAYFLTLMEWKLKRMSHEIKTKGHAESNNRTAKQIDYAIYLLNQSNTPLIDFQSFKDCTDKYGETKFIFGNKEYGDECFVPVEHMDLGVNVSYSKVSDKETYEEAREAFFKTYTDHDKYLEECKNRLFKHLSKYVKGWWD